MAQELILIVRAENMATQALAQATAQVKVLVNTTNTATKANTAVGKSALKASKGINSMAGSTKRLMTAMVGASLIYGAVRAVKAATKEYVEYDKQIHNLWTLTDYTKEQIDSLGKRIRAMSLDFTETAANTTRAMYQIYSATFYGEDAFNILEESLKGAAAGLSDVFTVADMMTTVLNAYSMEASEATRINDLLFTTIRYGKTTMHELATQFGRLAGVAAPLDVDIAELTASIATLTRMGISTDWAITSMRQSLMQVIRPTSALRMMIARLGYASGRTMVQQEGLVGSLKILSEQSGKTGIPMENLFTNIRAVTAVLPLTSNNMREVNKDMGRMASSAGAAAAAFKKKTESIDFQIGVLGSALKDLGATATEVFGRGFAIYLRDVVNPMLKTMVLYIQDNRDELLFFLKGFGKIVQAVTLIMLLAKAFKLLGNPIIWLIGLSSLFYVAWEANLFGIREKIDDLGDVLKAPLKWVLEMSGFDGIASKVDGWNSLLVAAIAGVGLSVLGKALFGLLGAKATASTTMSGGVIKLGIIALSAILAWDIGTDVAEIMDPGKDISLADKLPKFASMAAGGIAGIAGGPAGAVAGAALGGQAFEGLTDWLNGGSTMANVILLITKPQEWINTAVNAIRGTSPSFRGQIDSVQTYMDNSLGMGFAKGGNVPGLGSGDIIPAMLEPGEFVLPKWMMDNPAFSDAIRGIWSRGKRMASGGPAGFSASGSSGATVGQVVNAQLARLPATTERMLQPFADFMVKFGKDGEYVIDFFQNIAGLVSDTEEWQIVFENLVTAAQTEADKIASSSKTVTEALDELGNSIEKLLKDQLTSSIRDFLGNITGMNDEAGKAAKSFNIPKLLKLSRAAWGVATPGESYDSGAGAAGEEESDFEGLANGILDALATALGEISWTMLFGEEGIDWASLIDFSALYETIAGFFAQLFVGEGFFAALAVSIGIIGAAFFALGLVIGTIVGILSIVSAAFEGVALAIGEFFKPIIEAVKKEWEKLEPLRNAVRDAFAFLGPIFRVLGEIVAAGIDVMTSLFQGLEPIFIVLGAAIWLLAESIGWAWDHILKPVFDSIGFVFKLIGNIIIRTFNAIIDILNFLNPFGNPLKKADLIDYDIPSLATAPMQSWNVDRDGIAVVHKGETVGQGGGGNQYIYNVTLPNVANAQDFDAEMERITRMKNLRTTGVRAGSYQVT